MSIEHEASAHDWFHAIDLGGGVVTPGRFPPGIPPNYTLFPVWEVLEHTTLVGMDCIDIGAVDGIVAFTLKQEGATSVVATDRADRDAFRLVRDHLELDVHYLPDSTLDGSDIENKLKAANLPRRFDLVVLAGVIYHAYDPLIVLMHARRLMKANGLIVVETAFHPGDAAALYFNPEAEQPVMEPNTFFLPTPHGLEAMLRFAACNPLATVMNGSRMAVLARACRPSAVKGRTDALELIVRRGGHYGPLDFEQMEHDGHVSKVGYDGREGTWSVDQGRFNTRFKLQPAPDSRCRGRYT